MTKDWDSYELGQPVIAPIPKWMRCGQFHEQHEAEKLTCALMVPKHRKLLGYFFYFFMFFTKTGRFCRKKKNESRFRLKLNVREPKRRGTRMHVWSKTLRSTYRYFRQKYPNLVAALHFFREFEKFRVFLATCIRK